MPSSDLMPTAAPSSSWFTTENEEAGPLTELETNMAEADDEAVAGDGAKTVDEAAAGDGSCPSKAWQ